MGKIKKRKILRRLDRLERVVREYADRDRRGASEDQARQQRPQAANGFDEKRVIDTVVRLVVERVARVIQRENQIQFDRDHAPRHGDDHQHHHHQHHRHECCRDDRRHDDHAHADRSDGDGPRGGDRRWPDRARDDRGERGRDDLGGEKRVVDLIVGLVSEHVSGIVSLELDRRIGPPRPDVGADRAADPEVLPPEDADADEEDS